MEHHNIKGGSCQSQGYCGVQKRWPENSGSGGGGCSFDGGSGGFYGGGGGFRGVVF